MPTPLVQRLSRTLYTTDGTTTVWDFAFSDGYLDKSHVKARVDTPGGLRTEIVVTPSMLVGEFQLAIIPALSAGNTLTIYRDTPKDAPLVNFTDEAGFSEIALDTNARQAVMVAAETADEVNTSDIGIASESAVAAAASAATASSSASAAAASASAAAASAVAAAASVGALTADLASTAPSKGASIVAHDDGAGGSLWTTVAGFIAKLRSSSGSAVIGFIRTAAGAVARALHDKLSDTVSVKDFGAVGDGVADDTTKLQAAIDYAIANGKSLYIPAGKYLISATLNIIRPSGEYRADSFRIFGDGGGSVFLGYALCPGTVIFTNTDVPILSFAERIAGGFNNLYVEYMRLEQINSAATQPVISLAITAGYSRFSKLEIKQGGTGDGVKMLKGYLTTFEFCNIVNKDLVTIGGGISRVGVGINLVSAQSGGLFTARKVTCRGFLNGFVIGNGSVGLYSTKLDQCECSTVTNGVTVEVGIAKTNIDTCYFEAVYGKCVIDKGRSTTVSGCIMFSGFATGIDSTNTAVYGSVYRDNYILVDGTNSIGIEVYSDGDASGHQKLITGNHIYFLSSGGSVAGVNGIKITGANPAISIIDNNFRPRRVWVGGAGTTKINDASTGYNTGVTPLTDSLVEVPFLSNVAIGYVPSATTLTESNVTAGELALTASTWNTVNATVATNITKINDGNKGNRQVMIVNSNTNATFVKGPYMILASNFTGYGCIILQLRVIAGNTYAYEISRTMY